MAEPEQYDVNYKNLTVKTVDDSMITGKVNIRNFQRLSDMIKHSMEPYLTILSDKGSMKQSRLQRLQKQLQRLHLLVVDELGYVPFSKTGAELLFEVISRAYEHHSLMLTTNLAFEEWTEIFGSERLTGALLDRLTHRCHILEANGESYRLRQAKKRSHSKTSARQDPKQT